MKRRIRSLDCVALPGMMAIIVLGGARLSEAAAKPPVADTPPPTECRAIELSIDPSKTPALELPDGKTIDWAASFEARLSGLLTQGGRFRVITDHGPDARESLARRSLRSSGLEWNSTQNASVRISVNFPEVSFRTGSRGDRMLYGWTSRMTPASEPNPFRDAAHDFGEAAFAPRDASLVGTYAGLDLGEGLSLDLVFAWLRIKLARYDARVAVDLQASIAANASATEQVPIRSRARGFFFDVSGGYLGYQAGLEASRTDAMKRAIDRTVESIAGEIESRYDSAPRIARVDGWTLSADGSSNEVLLATATGCPLPQGLRLSDAGTGMVIEVTESHENGGIGRIISGKPDSSFVGRMVSESRQERSMDRSLRRLEAAAPDATSISSVALEAPEETIPKPDQILADDGVFEKSGAELVLERIAGELLLPYRIYRYFEHDQSYHKQADPVLDRTKAWSGIQNWSRAAADSEWGRKLGLAQAEDRSDGTVVAVIDTGVDYNHPLIHDRLWINPAPATDAYGEFDRYGWDFVSDDRRADDDQDRGTELASLVLAAAPHTRIMPLKAFNPWGVTRADLLASAIRYAVGNGADVILTAWNTDIVSRDLDGAVEAARAAGVVVVSPNDSELPLSDDDAFLVVRPRLRHGWIAGPSARAAIQAGMIARRGAEPRP